jgi:dipeptide/tripeptide permease
MSDTDKQNQVVITTKWIGIGSIILAFVWYFISLNTYHFNYTIPTYHKFISLVLILCGIGFLIFSFSNKKEKE